MHNSLRYRGNAEECLLAAKNARQPACRKLHLSMANLWISFALQEEALSNLLARLNTAEPSYDAPAVPRGTEWHQHLRVIEGGRQ